MPGFRDFMDEIKAAGVFVQGENTLEEAVSAHPDWASCVADFACDRRKSGVQFFRRAVDVPSALRLHEILSGYPFTFVQATAVVSNVLYLGEPETDPDAHNAPCSDLDPPIRERLEDALARLRSATLGNDLAEINSAMHLYACRLASEHGSIDAGKVFAKAAATVMVNVAPHVAREILLHPYGRDDDAGDGNACN